MTDHAPHGHLLFSAAARFRIQKGKMVGVYHEWGKGMGVRDGGQDQNLLLQVPRLLSWLLLLFVPSLSLVLGNLIHAFFLFFPSFFFIFGVKT